MLSRGYILVVDDEVNLCRILDAKLTKSGYEVMTVHDGQQAVEKVREKQFDLVLLDLILPKLDGLEALEKIRSINSDIPVIIMTACENTEAVTRALSKGASGFVSKPFDLDRLVTLVQSTSSEGRSISTEPTVMDGTGIFRRGQSVFIEAADRAEGSKDAKMLDRSESTLTIVMVKPSEADLFNAGDNIEGKIAGTDAMYRFSSSVLERRDNGEMILALPQVMYRVQRRKNPRVDIKSPALYWDSESLERHDAYTENIGIGGAMIVTTSPLAPGKTIELEVKAVLHLERVKCSGQVLRCFKSNEGGREQFRVAVKFEEADPELRRAVLQHIATGE